MLFVWYYFFFSFISFQRCRCCCCYSRCKISVYRNNQQYSHVSRFNIAWMYYETWDTFNLKQNLKKKNDKKMSKTNKNKTDRKVVYKISCAWYKMMFIPMDETSYTLYHHACALDIYTYVVGWVCVCVWSWLCVHVCKSTFSIRLNWGHNA